jgi:hypothetical protein
MEEEMDGMSKKEYARKKFAEIRGQIQELIDAAQRIADETGEEFDFEPRNIGTYYPAGSENHPYADGGASGEGEWYPSSWSSSSIYC